MSSKCPFCEQQRKHYSGNNYAKTCCSGVCKAEQRRQTNILKYGVANVSQAKHIKQQKKATTMSNYGVANPSQSNIVKDKKCQTSMERYGVMHTTQSDVKKEKTKQTNLERYGVEYTLQVAEIREQGNATKLEKYGDENFNNRDKAKVTNLEKYGYPHQMTCERVKSKARATNLRRYGNEHFIKTLCLPDIFMELYGVENPMQCPEIAKKCFESGYQSKDYIFPSGKTVKVQGYEGLALDVLLETYDEADIKTDTFDIPTIDYIGHDNKPHKYYPDIYIPKDNLLIEVKSTYTYKADLGKNLLKEQASKDTGYAFKFMIMEVSTA